MNLYRSNLKESIEYKIWLKGLWHLNSCWFKVIKIDIDLSQTRTSLYHATESETLSKDCTEEHKLTQIFVLLLAASVVMSSRKTDVL